MIIRNSKNTSLVNLDKVTQIFPSINEEKKIFSLYFVFDGSVGDEFNEVKWTLGSKDEIECILYAIGFKEV